MIEKLTNLLGKLEEESFNYLINGNMCMYTDVIGDISAIKEILSDPNRITNIEETTFILEKYKAQATTINNNEAQEVI